MEHGPDDQDLLTHHPEDARPPDFTAAVDELPLDAAPAEVPGGEILDLEPDGDGVAATVAPAASDTAPATAAPAKSAAPGGVVEQDVSALAGKYLTFGLADEEYGLAVLKVREIIKLVDITLVPQMPPYVKGVINLRGKVIPVIDLRLRFGLPSEMTPRTCIVVVDVRMNGTTLLMGMLVDAVSEVVSIAVEQIEPTPSFADSVETTAMSGIAKVKGKVKILLDLDRLFEAESALARVS